MLLSYKHCHNLVQSTDERCRVEAAESKTFDQGHEEPYEDDFCLITGTWQTAAAQATLAPTIDADANIDKQWKSWSCQLA